jgi:hypothetical protein
MSKITTTYWNPEATDQATGEITSLIRFLGGADTATFGGKAQDGPEWQARS